MGVGLGFGVDNTKRPFPFKRALKLQKSRNFFSEYRIHMISNRRRQKKTLRRGKEERATAAGGRNEKKTKQEVQGVCT